MLQALGLHQWILAGLASLTVGISKTGFSGVGMLTILFMAEAMGARPSTGIVLPMLIAADIMAVRLYRRHAVWSYIWKLLPPALVGVMLGWWMMPFVPETLFRRLLGAVVLALVLLQWWRMWHQSRASEVPDSKWLGWTMGGLSGVTTMFANAAGPIMTIYLLVMRLPKFAFVGTSACFFLVINICKVPFSAQMGLIRPDTVLMNLILLPGIILGFCVGNYWLKKISQKWFERVLILLTGAAACRLLLFV